MANEVQIFELFWKTGLVPGKPLGTYGDPGSINTTNLTVNYVPIIAAL